MTPPPRIPGYELLQPLGGGPFTQVWAAHDLADDERVALKRPRDDSPDEDMAVTLLRREARAGLEVRHPHLVRVRAAHVLSEPFFVVMDLLAGESLRDRLRRDYALPTATAVWVARQLAEALAALHRARFVHGDVKPENVWLLDSATAVLIDLGFAHRPGENATFRRRGLILGTANYLAPELCSGEEDADAAADWFALGVTLFETLTGRLPYPVGSMAETLRRHRDDAPTDLATLGTWPPGLVRLVTRLLTKRPAERPRGGAVVQELIGLEIATLRRASA